MNSTVSVLALGIALFFTSLSYGHNQQMPRVLEVNVNGFHVHLVDLQHGNQFGYVFAVPYGTSDDPPEFQGRAHYFEHMYARGSKRYPGHETLIKAMTGFGMQRNAATGMGHTFYFATGKEDHGLEAMTMHLASLEAPDLEPSSAAREKLTVINEVVVSAPNRPSGAIFYLPMMVLPEEGHPLRGYLIGERKTLEPMTPDDLRALHKEIYHQGNVKLAVFGNFSSGKHTHDEVIQSLMKALPAAREEVPAPYVPKAHPELFSKDQVLEIASTKERLGALFVPIQEGADLSAVSQFLSVFSSRFRNSVTDVLRRQMGFVEFVDAEAFRLGNQHYAMIDFRMTEEGYAKREEIARFLVAAIGAYQNEAVPEAVAAQMRDGTRLALQQSERDLDSLTSAFSTWLLEDRFQHHRQLDWNSVAAGISTAKIREGAKAVRTDRHVGVFMGPDQTHTSQHNELYNLNYGVRPWSVTKSEWPLPKPASILVPKLPEMNRVEPLQRLAKWTQHTEAGFTEVYDYDPSWSDRTITLRFQFGDLTPLEQASFQLWILMVKEELGPELSALASSGIALSIQPGHGELILNAQGATHGEANALSWLFQKIGDLPLNPRILDRLKGSSALSLARVEDGFPGSAAIGVVQELLAQRDRSSLKMAKAVPLVNAESIQNFWDGKLKASNKTVVIAGAFAASEVKKLKDKARELSPKPLGGALHLQMPGRAVSQNLTYRETWRDAGQTGVGAVRLYPGPEVSEIADRAAMGIIGELLKDQIFLRNRPLGYVQGAAQMPGPMNSHFVLYGQADREDQLAGMTKVWEEELEVFRTRQVKTEDFEKSRQGLLAKLSQLPASSDAAVGEILGNLGISGQPYYSERLAQSVKSVTQDEIYAAFDKYLSEQQPSMNVIKGAGEHLMSCELMLTAREDIRARLKVER